MPKLPSMDFLSNTWIPEICMIMLSWTSFGSIVFLLSFLNGNTLFQWHEVSLNVAVSAFSTLMNTTLLFVVSSCLGQYKYLDMSRKQSKLTRFAAFDEASRGVQGGLGLLWETRLRSMACLGALVTVLALFADPFFQRVITIGDHQTDIHRESTTIPRARKYSMGSQFSIPTISVSDCLGLSGSSSHSSEFNLGWRAVKSIADYSMQAAISAGLSEEIRELSKKLNVQCPAASCEWPAFSTLAVCSTCSDISDKLVRVREDCGNGCRYQAIDFALNSPSSAIFPGKNDKFQLPNRLAIQFEDPDGLGSIVQMVTQGTSNRSQTVTFPKNERLLWSLTMLKRHNPTPSNPQKFSATECGLSYCIQNIKSRFQNGTLYESSQMVDMDLAPGSFRLRDLPASAEPPSSLYSGCDIPRDDFSFQGGYNVSQVSINGIGSYLTNLLRGPIGEYHTSWDDWGTTGFYMSSFENKNGTKDPEDQFSPAAMQRIYESPNISATFQALAVSITNNFRTHDNENTVVFGTSSIIVYRIRWAWITLPLINLVIGSLFLGLITFLTTHHRVPLWKCSALAILKCGPLTGGVLNNSNSLAEIKKRAQGAPIAFLRPCGPAKKEEVESEVQLVSGYDLCLSVDIDRSKISVPYLDANNV